MQLLKLTVYSNGAVLLLSRPEHDSNGCRGADPQSSAPKAKMIVQWSREQSSGSRMNISLLRPFARSVYDEIVASPVLR